MGSDLLAALGGLTLGGSAAVILFALMSRVSRNRYAARWRCWVWVLLCLRMAIPFSLLPVGGGVPSAPIRIDLPPNTVIYEYTLPETGPAQQSAVPEEGPQAGTQSPIQSPSGSDSAEGQMPGGTQAAGERAKISISLSEIAVTLWVAGAAVMGLWVFISHLRFLRWMRRWARPTRDPDAIRLYNELGDRLELDRRPSLRVCDGLRAPMLAGVFRPVLLLPEEYLREDADTMRHILLHELTHYKRRDILLKALALLANIVHWFNPCMWYMVRLVERDTELACDEAALRRLPPEEHAAYGRTILAAVERLKKDAGKEPS